MRFFPVSRFEQATRVTTAFTLLLGASLTYFNAPTHHDRATTLLSKVLSQNPEEILALVCTAQITEAAERWAHAVKIWDQVPFTGKYGNAAREGKAWSLIGCGDYEVGLQMLDDLLDTLDGYGEEDGEEVVEQRAVVNWKIGKALWDSNRGRFAYDTCEHGLMHCTDKEQGYKHFIAALKLKPDYASAFTSLGLYYQWNGDSTRSSKCFQKAFELDAREVIAAQMLATSFSAEREWDLVEVIARRVVEGERSPIVVKAGAGAEKEVFVTRNLWAWKALGVVELVSLHLSVSLSAESSCRIKVLGHQLYSLGRLSLVLHRTIISLGHD
jgi:superkiller protein 3